MSLFKTQLLLTLALSIATSLPSLAVDEATMSKLQELLERAKARKLGKKYSTRDLVKDKESESEVESSQTKPSSYQPVINVNQNTKINGSGSSDASSSSYEDILKKYREKRESQKEEIIEEKKVVEPKPSEPKVEAVKKPDSSSTQVTKISSPKEEKSHEPAIKQEAESPKVQDPVKNYTPIKVETENKVNQSPTTNVISPNSSTENSNSIISPHPDSTNVLDHTRSVTPGFTDHKTLADREADYQLVLRKSLKSLEEDAWNEVKYNMGEARDYFAREKAKYPADKNIEIYYKIILAFQRFAEAGLELDQGDFADFEEAEALYLDSYDILDEVEKDLGDDLNSKNIKEILNTVRAYIDEDLEYIEEMIGIE